MNPRMTIAAPPNIQPMRRPVCRSDDTLVLASCSARLFQPRVECAALLASSITPATTPRINRARFIAQAPSHKRWDQARPPRGRHRGVRGTCCTGRSARPSFGFMHDSVSSRGTPRLDAQPDHVALVHRRKRRDHFEVVGEAEGQRPRHRGEELRRRIRERVARERAERQPSDPVLRAVDAGLAEEDHVAAGQVDILVRRVESRRLAAQRPVRGRVEVADRERELRRRGHAAEGRTAHQSLERRAFLRFPRQPGADVDRVHVRRARLRCGEHRAVEACGEKDGGLEP